MTVDLKLAEPDIVHKIEIVCSDILEIFKAHDLDGNHSLAALSAVAIVLLKMARDSMTPEARLELFSEMMRKNWEGMDVGQR